MCPSLQSALVSKPLILAPVMVEAEVVSVLAGEAEINQEHITASSCSVKQQILSLNEVKDWENVTNV